MGYVRAIARRWWIVAIWIVVGLAGGFVRTQVTTPVWASEVTFYITSPADSGGSVAGSVSAGQQLAEQSVGILTSGSLAQRVIDNTPGVGLSASQLATGLSAQAPLNSAQVTVAYRDPVRSRAQLVGQGLAGQFGPYFDKLQNVGSATVVAVAVLSGPTVGTTPVSPRPVLDLVVGAALGLVLGVASALATARIDITPRRRHRGTLPARPAAAPAEPAAADYDEAPVYDGQVDDPETTRRT